MGILEIESENTKLQNCLDNTRKVQIFKTWVGAVEADLNFRNRESSCKFRPKFGDIFGCHCPNPMPLKRDIRNFEARASLKSP